MCASYGLDPRIGDYASFAAANDTAAMQSLLAWAEQNAGATIRPTGRIARNLNPLIRGGQFELGWWGFLANGAPVKFASINTRLESLIDRPGKANRRVLVPASYWFEHEKPSKTRYAFTLPGRELFGIAAVAQTARLDDGTITTYSIVTRPAAAHITAIHDRMPLVIAPSMYASWLDEGQQGSRELVEAAAASSAELVPRVLAAAAPSK